MSPCIYYKGYVAMLEKCINLLICFALLSYCCGCYSSKAILTSEYEKQKHGPIEKVVLIDGNIVEFDAKMGMLSRGEVVGVTKTTRESKHIPISSIQAIYYSKFDTNKTIGLGYSIILGAGIISLIVVRQTLRGGVM